MKRINGVAMIEPDYIGDFHSINPRLVKAHTDYFWAKRGMSDPGGLTPAEQSHQQCEAARVKREARHAAGKARRS